MTPPNATSRADTRVLLQLMVSLGGPIVLQNLIGSSLNMLDSVMIGSLGTAQIAGVAIANQIFFVLNLFVFGVGSGAGVFVAQYWGGADMPGIRRSIGMGLLISLGGAALFFGVSQLMPRRLIALFSADPAVIDAGARFLAIVSVGFLFQAVSGVLIFVLRSMEKTRMPLIASSIALAVNTVLNYLLIFGAPGLPAMGVEGSALATIIARLLELGLILVAMQGKHGVPGLFAAPRLRELFAIDRVFLRRFLTVILPVVGNEVGWSLGIALETAVFGRMSTDALAAFNIADTAIKLVIVVFFGVINTSAIVVGKRIGAGDAPGAVHAARVYTRFSPLLGAALGLACVGLSLFVPSFFNVSGQARHWAMLGMIIYGAAMPLRMLNWEMVVGVLRAGGDTGVAMALDVGGTWLVGLPLAAAAGLLLGAPFWVVYLCALMEDVPKFFLGIWRVRSRRWLNDLTGRAGVSTER
jgi:putative MATE family efflux protein